MVPAELLNYIKENLRQGFPPEKIKSTLTQAGWQPLLIEQAFSEITLTPPTLPEQDNFIKGTLIIKPVEPKEIEPVSTAPFEDSSLPKILNILLSIFNGHKKFPAILACLVLGFFTAVYPSYKTVKTYLPLTQNIDKQIIDAVYEAFPEEVEITIKDGEASSNVTEPYYLTISQKTLENLLQTGNSKQESISKIRLLTINTNGKIEDFDRFQSFSMLTRSNFVYYNNGKLNIQSLSSVPNMIISKQNVINKIDELKTKYKIMGAAKTLLYLSPLLILIFSFLNYLFMITIESFIIWLINKILKAKISFGILFRFTAALYFFPLIFLICLQYIPKLNLFYGWIATIINVLILSTAYLFMKEKNKNPL